MEDIWGFYLYVTLGYFEMIFFFKKKTKNKIDNEQNLVPSQELN